MCWWGHSYGSAVISQAAASLDNVTGLVFLAQPEKVAVFIRRALG
ncbi:alpha/beta hydrolase [Frankia tisae]|nr:alpha/beta hydrolase [Frankia tisae]